MFRQSEMPYPSSNSRKEPDDVDASVQLVEGGVLVPERVLAHGLLGR
jgi:hypothetical protein